MPHSYSACLIHVVFSTRGRRKFITDEIRERVWAYMGGIACENNMNPIAIGGTDDHVHLLLSLPATVPIAKAVQLIKGGSSKWVHETFPHTLDFAWQQGYGAFSIGVSGISATVSYIKGQAAHHRTRSFEDEFTAFLKRHRIEYDPVHAFG